MVRVGYMQELRQQMRACMERMCSSFRRTHEQMSQLVLTVCHEDDEDDKGFDEGAKPFLAIGKCDDEVDKRSHYQDLQDDAWEWG